jgi:hypothetical protein
VLDPEPLEVPLDVGDVSEVAVGEGDVLPVPEAVPLLVDDERADADACADAVPALVPVAVPDPLPEEDPLPVCVAQAVGVVSDDALLTAEAVALPLPVENDEPLAAADAVSAPDPVAVPDSVPWEEGVKSADA